MVFHPRLNWLFLSCDPTQNTVRWEIHRRGDLCCSRSCRSYVLERRRGARENSYVFEFRSFFRWRNTVRCNFKIHTSSSKRTAATLHIIIAVDKVYFVNNFNRNLYFSLNQVINTTKCARQTLRCTLRTKFQSTHRRMIAGWSLETSKMVCYDKFWWVWNCFTTAFNFVMNEMLFWDQCSRRYCVYIWMWPNFVPGWDRIARDHCLYGSSPDLLLFEIPLILSFFVTQADQRFTMCRITWTTIQVVRKWCLI